MKIQRTETGRGLAARAPGAAGIVLIFALTSLGAQGQQQPGKHGGAAIPDLFATSASCQVCHNRVETPDGEDASFGTDWRASMMANSSRDPYWQAAIRREILERPALAAEIQDECGACHMPMTRYQARVEGRKGEVFAHLPAGTHADRPGFLAADGVSCAVCHQIRPEGLGTEESYSAGFVIDTERPRGQREAYGPFDVDPGRQKIMRSMSRFTPRRGNHIQSSEVCASCHTLLTHALGVDGEVLGELPEQVPYLEWKHSSYRERRSCQSCHMPEVEGAMPVSSVMGVDRERVSRHVFRGGNFVMPAVLDSHRDELGVEAEPAEMDAAVRRTREHLQASAATLAVSGLKLSGRTLEGVVMVESRAGHKLPTAYPSRRAWLHVMVMDGAGRTLFESGRFGSDGSIQGNDNDEDPGRYEPHHAEITDPGQVQIYEAIMADGAGAPTTVLLSGVRFAKDNRILPAGFDKATAGERVAVRGAASEDGDFTAGGDQVRYAVDVGEAGGPFTLRAELWYQPVAYRWAINLGARKAPEITRFTRYYAEMGGESALVLASAESSTP